MPLLHRTNIARTFARSWRPLANDTFRTLVFTAAFSLSTQVAIHSDQSTSSSWRSCLKWSMSCQWLPRQTAWWWTNARRLKKRYVCELILSGRTNVSQIRAEFEYHNIRLYPFDSEEHDEEEVELNNSIRVRIDITLSRMHLLTRTSPWSPSPLSVQNAMSSSMVSKCEGVRTDGALSMWKMNATANLCIYGTSFFGKYSSLYCPFLLYNACQDTPAGSHRDNGTNTLRGIPLEATACSQRCLV